MKEREAEISVEPEKPLSEMNILEMVEYFMDQGMTEEQANDLANSEWQARQINDAPVIQEPVQQSVTEEALYLVDDTVYLHVQPTDGGWDYSLYDKETKKLMDGGVIVEQGDEALLIDKHAAHERILFEKINSVLAPMRERYEYLMAHPDEIDATLAHGAEIACKIADKKVAKVIKAMLGK